MSHGRTQIRAALAGILTGLELTADRVFINRVYTVTDAELPCLIINTDSEQIVAATLKPPRIQERQLAVTVRVLARATVLLDETLDAILAEIETVIAANRTLNCTASDCRVDHIDISFYDGAEQPTGQALVTLLIDWIATEGEPAAIL